MSATAAQSIATFASLRHLLGITKLGKEKNQCIGEKDGNTEHRKENKTAPQKVAPTRTED